MESRGPQVDDSLSGQLSYGYVVLGCVCVSVYEVCMCASMCECVSMCNECLSACVCRGQKHQVALCWSYSQL